jgi:heme-degrading monooxygenase HmoA
MYARIARYKIPQERFGEVVAAFREPVERLREVEGNRGGYFLIDRENCTATSLTLWEDQAALEASKVAASRLRSEAVDAVDGEIQMVDDCEVAIDFSEQARV